MEPLVTHRDAHSATVAGDGCMLREILHPRTMPLALPYSVAHATVAGGKRTLNHRLEQAEVYYIIAGAGRISVDDVAIELTPGSVVWVPPGSAQWVENTTKAPLEFLCIVDPPWTAAGEHISILPNPDERID